MKKILLLINISILFLLSLNNTNISFANLDGYVEPDHTTTSDPYKLPAVRPFLQGYSPAMLTLLSQTLTWDLPTDFDKMENYFKQYTKKYFGDKNSLNDFEGAEKILLIRTIKRDLELQRSDYARNRIEYDSVKKNKNNTYASQLKDNLADLAMKIHATHMMLGTQMGYCFEKENEACWILDLDKKAQNYQLIRGTKQEKIDDLKIQFTQSGTFYNTYIDLKDKYTTKTYKNIDLYMLNIIITNFVDNINTINGNTSKTDEEKKTSIENLRKDFYNELSPIVKANKLKDFNKFLSNEVELIKKNDSSSLLIVKKGYKLLTKKMRDDLNKKIDSISNIGDRWQAVSNYIDTYEKSILNAKSVGTKKLYREILYFMQDKSKELMELSNK